MGQDAPPDLNDVSYDAFLANDRTLADPQIVRVSPGERVRLRIVNVASASNFHLDLGALRGTVLAVDGHPAEKLTASSFPLAIAQRIDLLVELPKQGGAWPISPSWRAWAGAPASSWRRRACGFRASRTEPAGHPVQ